MPREIRGLWRIGVQVRMKRDGRGRKKNRDGKIIETKGAKSKKRKDERKPGYTRYIPHESVAPSCLFVYSRGRRPQSIDFSESARAPSRPRRIRPRTYRAESAPAELTVELGVFGKHAAAWARAQRLLVRPNTTWHTFLRIFRPMWRLRLSRPSQ